MFGRKQKTLGGSIVSGLALLAYLGFKIFRISGAFEGDNWSKTQTLSSSDQRVSISVPGNWEIEGQAAQTTIAHPKNNDDRAIGITHVENPDATLTKEDLLASFKEKYPAGNVHFLNSGKDPIISWESEEQESGSTFAVQAYAVLHKSRSGKPDIAILTAVIPKSKINSTESRSVIDHVQEAAQTISFIE